MLRALALAAESAGRSSVARIPMMAITTSSSIKVNAALFLKVAFSFGHGDLPRMAIMQLRLKSRQRVLQPILDYDFHFVCENPFPWFFIQLIRFISRLISD